MGNPDWYWTKGLHDAKVINVLFKNIDYEFTKRNPIRNFLDIQLDSQKAMFDTTIKSIKLYNSKIIEGDLDFIGWYWKDDKLIETTKGFELEITLILYPHTKKIKISFEKVDIGRI